MIRKLIILITNIIDGIIIMRMIENKEFIQIGECDSIQIGCRQGNRLNISNHTNNNLKNNTVDYKIHIIVDSFHE